MEDTSGPSPVLWVRSDRLLLVWLRGAIDPVVGALLRQVTSAAMRSDRVVLDLTAVTFFGSTGLNFIAGLANRVAAPIVVSGLPDFVRSVLMRSGMHTLVSLPVR
ncbi:STAS domain-containing protein [Cryptosporangium phraense]|uniref:STAS domain-containing protein n=1 Tax=Cryptosporangium phraense TaxID=2593070 RepID=UPI001478EB1E|nr:STAS domain-containing protein [Cryptosporangium phraense]